VDASQGAIKKLTRDFEVQQAKLAESYEQKLDSYASKHANMVRFASIGVLPLSFREYY